MIPTELLIFASTGASVDRIEAKVRNHQIAIVPWMDAAVPCWSRDIALDLYAMYAACHQN
jgi:hypothetical protein